MTLKVPALELDRVIQNVLHYTDNQAIRLQEVFFVISNKGLQAFSCDDYVTVTDSLSVDSDLSFEFSLSIEDVDKLGAWIKKDKKVVHKYPIEIRQKFTGVLFECDETSTDDESDNFFLSFKSPNYEAWGLVMLLLDEEAEQTDYTGFALRSERLVKLARLKADKDAPIDMRFVLINGHLIVQFKKGETLKGAIMPVTRSLVKEEFLWPIIDQ